MTSELRSGQGGFSSERQQLLKLLLRDKGVKAPQRAPITRRSDFATPARLSFAQQRLWIIDRLEPGSASYNIPVTLRLLGRLDVPALLAAMAEVVRRHEALRTTFAENDDTPLQVVHPPPARAGAVVDLAELPERDRELQRLVKEEAARPFDLQRGPLVRLTLIRLGEAEHAFLMTMHHIVSDGWSAGVFVREMTTLYLAFSQGRPSPLPELAIQYPDFSEWQRSWLSGDRLDEQLRYWREQLAGAPPALDLPTDRPRPVMPDGRGGVRTFDIAPDVAGALSALCRREGVTLFMALLAAFGTVLGRHAGQRDVVVGSPIANRNRAEI
ncbi:MAG TPA: condensation domain-containing protein, partial [Thermoanaerobaculia bacterium]|nr:condensation domain-containing protein [Thermoanaerobaculia bacterium]